MTRRSFVTALWVVLMAWVASSASAAETIPTQAWSRDVNAGGYLDGAPIGGFGAGTLTWRFDGQFYKTRLNIGAGSDNGSSFTADANSSFYYYCKPASGAVSFSKLNATTLGSGQATYYSLFPKSWVSYTGSRFPVKAQVTQFSPLIPNDYQRVSYPTGVYKWELTNSSAVTQDVAIMLTWQNNDFSGTAAAATQMGNDVLLTLQRAGTTAATSKNQGEYTIASTGSASVTVTYESAAALATLETDFQADGLLNNAVGTQTLGAISVKTTLAPGATATIPIVLSWDIPIAQPNGDMWYRQYTRYFGNTGLNSRAIAEEGLANYASWEASLDAWQSPVLSNTSYPTWLKSMLFNELYIYFAGGTIWTAGPASGQAYQNANESLFSHLESYIYPFYGTSDVRFYGSWALFLNWPDIDKQAVRQFCDSVWTNRTDRPAALGTCAHDFGDTTNNNGRDPNGVFTAWNAYNYRDSTTWKDLNSKLVLMVYRDWLLTGKTDTTFLNYCWQPVTIAMAKTKSEDTNGDGLPDSSGVDQTYDDMGLTGYTAYCGGLFLAACQAAQQLAIAMGNNALATQYASWFTAGQATYESKLWTGTYYQIDTGSTAPTRIMSDQLCGEWYSKALGLGGIVTDAHALSAYNTIYSNNYQKFDAGANGVVNVMTAAGAIDTSTSQTQEAWTGPAWGVVSGMVHLGLTAPASAIGQSLYNTIWNNKQFWFRTPEAWTTGVNNVRAYYYMRATAIWGVKQAIDVMMPASCGSFTCTPTLTGTPTLSPTRTGTPTPTATVNPCAAAIRRVNCGGPTTVINGVTWTADQAWAANGWGYVNGTAAAIAGPVTGANAGLCLTERYANPLEYRFTLNNGTYGVNLKFVEQAFNATGKRIFSVALNGTTVITNLDIFSEKGEFTEDDKGPFYVTVSGGALTIIGTSTVDNAEMVGIEILDMSTTCTPAITSTFTATRTPTPTLTLTPTATRTQTPTPTVTATLTRTATMTQTATSTATPTTTGTWTSTATSTRTLTTTSTLTSTQTGTFTWSATRTPTSTSTFTATATPTSTVTNIQTSTFTWSATRTPTSTSTLTATVTPTSTATNTQTSTPTWSVTRSSTFTATSTASWTSSTTPTVPWSPTRTLTATMTFSPTNTGTFTVTSTGTQPPTNSPTVTSTVTSTSTRTVTPTWSSTASFTSTLSATPSWTRTATITATWTGTATSSRTTTPSETATSTASATPTPSGTSTRTPSATATSTASWTASATVSLTATLPPTATYTSTPSMTSTSTSTGTLPPTSTWTVTGTPTDSVTETPTATRTITASWTSTASTTWTQSFTATNTSTSTPTKTWTSIFTSTATPSFTVMPSFTPSRTNTPSFTQTSTPTATGTFTGTTTSTWTASWTFTATETPTSSWSNTPTATASTTETETISATMTPSLSVGRMPVVYPNPVKGGDPIRVAFNPVETTGKLRVTVVSVAYRKVFERTFLLSGRTGVVDLTLDSSLWNPANGMYYLVLRYPSGKTEVAKFVVLR
jgi:non-lysosomal glucosylceramidase